MIYLESEFPSGTVVTVYVRTLMSDINSVCVTSAIPGLERDVERYDASVGVLLAISNDRDGAVWYLHHWSKMF